MGIKIRCEECEYLATQKDHKDNQYQCVHKVERNVDINFEHHQQTVHLSRKFLCDECDYEATQKGDLLKHKQSIHIDL